MTPRKAWYRRLLRDSRWRTFRREVIELDGFACRRCGRVEGEITLSVHHTRYETGRVPWEYPVDTFETLCAGCHAREHGILPPAEGWSFLFDTDLEDLAGQCEYCGTQIRYVFSIHHPRWEMMDVGTVCCDRLTGTRYASELMEAIERRDRFIASPRWRDQRNGVQTIVQAGIDVAVVAVGTGFMVKMNRVRGRRLYPSVKEARAAAFDAIRTGAAAKFLASKSP